MSTTPNHILNLHLKPREAISGSAGSPLNRDRLIRPFEVVNYTHIITAMGGDDTAKMTIYGITPQDADFFQQNYVGNRASITVDNPIAPIFDGFISSVDVVSGGLLKRRSLDNMANYLSVIYSDNSGNTQTSALSNAASIAQYGYIGKVLDIGEHNASGAGIAADIASAELAKRAFPQDAVVQEAGAFRCEITIKGWQYTLEWEAFEVANTWGGSPLPATLENAWIVVLRHLIANSVLTTNSYAGFNSSNIAGNGQGLFYNDIDLSRIAQNTAFTHSSERKGGTSRRQLLSELAIAGDGTNKWLWGITRTDLFGKRVSYYRSQSTAVKYRTDPAGTGRVYDYFGALQRPWTVQPDCFIEIASRSIGEALRGTQAVYINKVEYDQNAQSVKWSTEEDISTRGTFQTDKFIKDTTTPFGAGARNNW